MTKFRQEPQKIIILGAIGNCVDILETLSDINDANGAPLYTCIGFLDDSKELQGKKVHGVPVLGLIANAREHQGAVFINGIGSPSTYMFRSEIVGRTGIQLGQFATVVHPTSYVSRSATLGRGTAILQNVTVASGAKIGSHVTILPNTIISHDAIIDDYSIVAGGVCLSGGVKVGKHCYIGSNSSVVGYATIADGSLVGMGSVVLEDVAPKTVVVGNPARHLRVTPEK